MDGSQWSGHSCSLASFGYRIFSAIRYRAIVAAQLICNFAALALRALVVGANYG
jgi:hypothetical protein